MSALKLAGVKFGLLTVLAKAETLKEKTRWTCACECGNTKVFATRDLRRGDSTSCGCLPRPTKHGHSKKGQRTRTYRVWAGMLQRCNNPNTRDYAFYGAKGILVCERWKDFSNFLADMGEAVGDLTIDRKDSHKDYEPGNCQWIPHAENSGKALDAYRKSRQVYKRMTFATQLQAA